MANMFPSWRDLAETTLQEVRLEALKRVNAMGMAPSVRAHRTVVTLEKNGWRAEPETVELCVVNTAEGQVAIRDYSVEHLAGAGFRQQLEPLAVVLEKETKLGSRPSQGLLPTLRGSDAVLTRYLATWAGSYLRQLSSLERDDRDLMRRMVGELVDCASMTHGSRVYQLVVGGLALEKELVDGPVSARPLTATEMGLIADRNHGFSTVTLVPESTVVLPSDMKLVAPDTLLECRVEHEFDDISFQSAWPQRLILALFLQGYDIGMLGGMTYWEEPHWQFQGHMSSPFPVGDRHASGRKPMTLDDLKAVRLLAERMPDFGADESTREQVVLQRCLRGCGAKNDLEGFLDFAICLESALLGGVRDELSYRFKLYGSLFLDKDFDVSDTWAQLGIIYNARSRLVHGSPSTKARDAKLHADAARHARGLAKAVVLRALENGWPDPNQLDLAAREHPPDAG